MPLGRRVNRHYALIVSIILIGVVSSIAAFIASRNRDYQRLSHSFEDEANHRYDTLRMQIARDLGAVESLQALYESTDYVLRSQFQDFGKYSLSSHPAIEALVWIPRVPAEQREYYEMEARQEGFPSFRIEEPDGRGKMVRVSNRAEFFPVYFVEPHRLEGVSPGFDLGSSETGRAALEKARDAGTLVASGRVSLARDIPGRLGFFVFAPVYRREMPLRTVEERRRNLRGFVAGVFRIGDMLESALNNGSHGDIPFSIYDTASPAAERFLYRHSTSPSLGSRPSGASAAPASDPPLQFARSMDVGGREWLVVFTGDPQQITGNRTWQPWYVLVVGLLFTGLVATYLLANIRYMVSLSAVNSHLREEAVERTRMERALRESEELYRSLFDNMLDGLAYCKADFDGNVPVDFTYIEVNSAFERLTGLKDVVGKRVSDIIPGVRESNPELFEVYGRVALTGIPERFETWVEPLAQWFSISVYSPRKEHFVALFDVITEQKRAEEAVKRSEATLKSVLSASPVGIVLCRNDRAIDWMNDRLSAMTGYTLDEVKGKVPTFLYPSSDEFLRIEEELYEPIRLGGVGIAEMKWVHKDGTLHDIHVRGAAIDPQDTSAGIVFTAADITEQKLAGELLRESENKFRDLVEKASVGVYLIQDGVFKYVNSRFAEIHGYAVHELIDRKGPMDLLAEPDPRGSQEGPGDDLSGREDRSPGEQFKIRTKQEEIRSVEVYSTLTMYKGKRAVIGTLVDATERKLAEEALRWKTAFLEALLDTSPDGILVTDGQGENILHNRRTVELWKVPPEVVDDKEHEAWARHAQSMVKDQRGFNQQVSYEQCHPNESVRDEIELTDGTVLDRYSCPVVGKDGTYYGRILGFHDITERRQAEELLKRIIASSPMGIFILQHKKTQMVNAQFESFTGYTEKEAAEMDLHSLIHPDDRAKVKDLGRKMLKGELTTPYEYRIQTKSGEIRTLMETITPIHYRGESAILGNVMNTTDRKMLESQLAQAQKLEAIGQLAAGIAHEINTPIQYVGDNVTFLRDAFRDTLGLLEEYNALLGAAREKSIGDAIIARVEKKAESIDLPYLEREIPCAIGQSLEGIGKVAAIVHAMKEFSHPGTKEKSLVDINRAIENTITISRNEWKYVSDVVTDFDPTLPLVPCLPGEFNQVILNLIVNAAQAMGEIHDGSDEKGTIGIATRLTRDSVEIKVSDTGPGIPQSIRSRIFDPFFTTKQVGKGTGQGLAIARSVIVDKHSGTIDCETEVGRGTTFIVSLPIDDKRNGDRNERTDNVRR